MKIIALQGKGEKGKTTTLKLLTLKIFENYPNIEIVYSNRKNNNNLCDKIKKEIEKEKINRRRNLNNRLRNIIIILKINNRIIGICTLGDTEGALESAFKKFEECDLCFCACRTKGGTVDFLEQRKDDLSFIKKDILDLNSENFNDEIDKVNSQQAKELLDILIDYIED